MYPEVSLLALLPFHHEALNLLHPHSSGSQGVAGTDSFKRFDGKILSKSEKWRVGLVSQSSISRPHCTLSPLLVVKMVWTSLLLRGPFNAWILAV